MGLVVPHARNSAAEPKEEVMFSLCANLDRKGRVPLS
jgi:hypothetical protein